MKSFQALKARATDAVKGSVERIQAARRQYYGEGPAEPSAPVPAQPAAETAAEPDAVLERLLHNARSPEVREQFLLIPPENYTTHHQVKVLAATYNVNGRPPPEDVDLAPWLGGGRYADVVAVGFQEIVPLNATNIVLGATEDAALAWDARVAAALNGEGDQSPAQLGSNGGASFRRQEGENGTGAASTAAAAGGAAGGAAGDAFAAFGGGSRSSSITSSVAPEPAPLLSFSPSAAAPVPSRAAGAGRGSPREGASSAEGQGTDADAAAGAAGHSRLSVDELLGWGTPPQSPPKPPPRLQPAAAGGSGSGSGTVPAEEAVGQWDRELLGDLAGLALDSTLDQLDTERDMEQAGEGPSEGWQIASGDGSGTAAAAAAAAAAAGAAAGTRDEAAEAAAVGGAEVADAEGGRGAVAGTHAYDRSRSQGHVRESQGHLTADPEEFVQVAAKQMVGVYLSVWARRRLLPHIRGVQVLSVATGALGYFGNKGAVAVRMRVYDSGLCFINAHLSSGEAEGDELRRHYDYGEVVRRGFFPPEEGTQAAADAQAGISKVMQPGGRGEEWGGALHLLDVDHAFWVGDLNYRLAGTSGQEALAAMQAGELEALLARDQLRQAMRSRQAFHGWQEAHITFPPTFKLRRGTSQYLAAEAWGGEGAAGPPSSSGAPSSADLAGLQDVIQDVDSTFTLTASQAAFEADSNAAKARAGGSSSSKAPLVSPAGSNLSSTSSYPYPGPNGSGSGGGNGGNNGSASRPEKPEKPEKARVPAWTDRILWRSTGSGSGGTSGLGPGGSSGGMRQLSYSAAEGVRVSDHRPVAAAFVVEAREYVREQVDAALEVARRVADAREMAAVPHCAAQPTSLELGVLEYGQVVERVVTLTNTAQAPATFRFVPVPGTSRPLPPWLSSLPPQGCVPVGGSAHLTLRACVVGGPSGAAEAVVAEQRCCLDCILVLRVEGGNDVFLSLSGRYLPSCFGLSWSTLAALPRPIATASSSSASAGGGGGSGANSSSGCLKVEGDTFFDPLHTPGQVPPELVRLTDLLRHSSWLATPGLFAKSSDLATAAAAAAAAVRRRSSSSWEGAGGGASDATSGALGGSGSRGGGEGGVGGAAITHWPQSPRSARRHEAAVGLLQFDCGAGADGGASPPPAAAGSSGSMGGMGSGSVHSMRSASDHFENGLSVGSVGSGGSMGSGLPSSPMSPATPSAAHRHAALLAVRRALDSGGPLPEGADAHDAAAALLAFFAALPQPFMPPDVVQVCDVTVPAAPTAASLLLDSFSPTELAVLVHMLLLMVEVLAPENRHSNGLSPTSLAAILAEVWFPAVPASPAATPTSQLPGRTAGSASAGALGAGSAGPAAAGTLSVAEISMRRIEFVRLLLEEEGVLQTLCAGL